MRFGNCLQSCRVTSNLLRSPGFPLGLADALVLGSARLAAFSGRLNPGLCIGSEISTQLASESLCA